MLTRSGALVNVPSPERYAIHKLIVSVMRKATGTSAVKAEKDVTQASLLIEALISKRREDDLASAFDEAIARGESWRRNIQKASTRLTGEALELVQSRIKD